MISPTTDIDSQAPTIHLGCIPHKNLSSSISRVERKTVVTQKIFLKPLFRGNFDLFVNSANLGAIAHTSNAHMSNGT